MKSDRNKIIFANQLRGVAALIVLIWHFYCVFFQYPTAVVDLLGVESYNVTSVPLLSSLLYKLSYLNLGQLGVAIFFLISGFVIPFSLKKYSLKAFGINRFMRLFPTYLVCLGLGLIVLFLMKSNFHSVSLKGFLTQVFFIRDWFFYPQIDGLVWTLEVEVKFYVLSVLIFWMLAKNVRSRHLLGISFLILMASEIFRLKSVSFLNHGLSGIVYAFESVFIFIPFMLIGWLFHLQFQSKKSNFKLAASVLAFFVVYAFNVYRSVYFSELFYKMLFNYFLALFLFSISFYKQNLFSKNRLLDGLAKISYSLYASHALIGYSIMYVLYQQKIAVEIIPVLTILCCVVISSCIFFFVEKPTQDIAKK